MPKMIIGDRFNCYVLRSIDWINRRATFEDLSAPLLDFKNRFRSEYFGEDMPLPINKAYLRRYLERLLTFAESHSKGTGRVSKRCIKRIEAQLQAIQEESQFEVDAS